MFKSDLRLADEAESPTEWIIIWLTCVFNAVASHVLEGGMVELGDHRHRALRSKKLLTGKFVNVERMRRLYLLPRLKTLGWQTGGGCLYFLTRGHAP